MKKNLLQALGILLVSVVATLFLEYYDEQRIQASRQQEIEQQLQKLQSKLQYAIAEVMEKNALLAERLVEQPEAVDDPEGYGIISDDLLPPFFLNVTFARDYVVVATYPYEGNESVIGTNYLFRPNILPGVERAVQRRGTVISSRVNLLQSGHQGFVIRTPLFTPDGEHFGFVSVAVDLEQILKDIGYDPSLGFELLIAAQHPDWETQLLRGNASQFDELPSGVQVNVPEGGVWELRGKPIKIDAGGLLQRADYIRLIGASLTFFILLVFLWRRGLLRDLNIFQRRLSLRMALLLVTVVPMALLFVVLELLSIRSIFLLSQQQMKNQSQLLMRQVNAHIESLFEISRQVTFHADLFRQGILSLDNVGEALSFFTSQLRIQPDLTYLSLATPEGEYYAAGRAPTGEDRNLRMQWANSSTGQQIHLHWVDDSNQPSGDFIRGNTAFDPRETVWYQHALENQSTRWYPVYQYTTHDSRQQFTGLGIGMSAPIFSPQNEFQGVIAADIALSEISNSLEKLSQDFDGIIFLSEKNGQMLATSTQDPLYLNQAVDIIRLTLKDNTNPLIRQAGEIIDKSNSLHGSQLLRFNGQMQLFSWEYIDVPDGPDLTLGVIIPSDALSAATHKIWRNALYVTWLLLVLGMILAFASTTWISQPLQALESWARKLRRGHWNEPMPGIGPITEVRSLRNSLEEMAEQLHIHTAELEQLVRRRTEELRLANQKLHQLSTTDGLTGLANRRYLDERARTLWSLALPKELGMAVLMVDVDDFKKYNDRYGHPAGDRCLEHIAQVLKKYSRRAMDIAGRYGGEEFAILYVDLSKQQVIQLAEQIVAAVQALELQHEDSPFGQVTVSVGLAHTVPQPDSNVERLLKKADEALYVAKATGRNRVVY